LTGGTIVYPARSNCLRARAEPATREPPGGCRAAGRRRRPEQGRADPSGASLFDSAVRVARRGRRETNDSWHDRLRAPEPGQRRPATVV